MNKMKKTMRWTVIIFALLFVVSQFIRPAKTNPTIDESRALQNQVVLPAEVESVLRRACYDCHSNDTRWPWYSHVAPVSWFVTDHVNHGRRHLNFSDWASYSRQDKALKIYLIGETVRLEAMPLSTYTILHRDARLSSTERQLLKDWARAEGERQRAQGQTAYLIKLAE